ncbi:uncharacterized protein C8R40DRAFT_1174655 [Lentinula edodes]|uniref:uncharacterized protein n=1 Tax=Lentinula edodes TaxID=5353 RepID=UPI001E8D4967|nr:uncharacterized protein C8R40DRAFT_1174655 [Lentinula edodes]KAH7871533.1 hypothetical protein C8R40DRAFT_1174655 [Lentinula edodes]
MLLKLFNQEYELAEGQLGVYYHSDSFYGPMSSGTLTFQTKKENQQGGASRPFSGSPSKGNRSKFVSGSPRKSAVTTGSEQFTIKNLTVSPFLEWDAKIPVYDGCARSQSKYQGFSFAPKDWDSLTSLPRYLKELPDDVVVTVGFTLTAWSIAELPTAHFFIAFVILLALPVKN